MNFTTAIRNCLRKSFTWSGRAPRSEYWWFVLFMVLVGGITYILDLSLFGVQPDRSDGPLQRLMTVVLLFPGLAAAVRRLHDTDHSAWYILIPFGGYLLALILLLLFLNLDWLFGTALSEVVGLSIASVIIFVSFLFQFWWFIQRGVRGPNRYGTDPLEVQK